MAIYHYAVIEKPETNLSADNLSNIDMENLDYKRQVDTVELAQSIRDVGGIVSGIWRGGMFGLSTNQVSVLSAWDANTSPSEIFSSTIASPDQLIADCGEYEATVRPDKAEPIEREGIYIIRWIRMLSKDIAEYTSLCLETWPAFEAGATCRCYGVFRPRKQEEISKILMLTWYATMNDWEVSRKLDPRDKAKWARRSEMELSHWADGGRLIKS